MPILLAYGDRDVFVPVEHAVALHRQLPDSRLLVVPDSGARGDGQPASASSTRPPQTFWRSTEPVARERGRAQARAACDSTRGTGAVVGRTRPAHLAWHGGDEMVTLAGSVPQTGRRGGGAGDVPASVPRRSTCRSSSGAGLRSSVAQRVTGTFTDSDLVLVNHMSFDDRASLDAAMASDEMRAAGRNLREIAPGMLTLVVLEDAVT